MADGANSGIYNFGAANILGLAFANGTITEAQIGGAAPATALPGSGFELYYYDNGGTSAAEDKDLQDKNDLDTAGAAESDATDAGEVSISRNSTDFDNLASNNTDNRGELQMKDVSLLNSSGADINNLYYVILMDANATPADQALYIFWGLGSGGHTLTNGSTLTVQNAEVRIST